MFVGSFSMAEPDLIELFARPLAQGNFRYFISGSVAAMLYGEPRVTLDIDFVVFLRSADLAILPQLYPAPDFYVPPFEVIAVEVARERRGHFNVIHSGSGLKADFYTANRDELHAWAFRRIQQYSVGGLSVSLAPPEYVILRKLEYYREGGSEKHLRDIRGMLAMSGQAIDHAELARWVDRRGLKAEWERIGS